MMHNTNKSKRKWYVDMVMKTKHDGNTKESQTMKNSERTHLTPPELARPESRSLEWPIPHFINKLQALKHLKISDSSRSAQHISSQCHCNNYKLPFIFSCLPLSFLPFTNLNISPRWCCFFLCIIPHHCNGYSGASANRLCFHALVLRRFRGGGESLNTDPESNAPHPCSWLRSISSELQSASLFSLFSFLHWL